MPIRQRVGTWVAVGILILLLLKISGLLKPLEEGARFILLPAGRLMSSAGLGLRNILLGSPDYVSLKERNRDLERRLTNLAVDYTKLRSLEEENRSLNDLIKFTQDSGYDAVPARIIARNPNPLRASILIDKGSRDGVETGMAVVVGQGIFIGKVTGLKERVSTVTLISDVASRVAAASINQNVLIGLVEGRGNNVARLTLVPQAVALKPDDVIVTAGTEDKIPADLLVGLVNEVEGKPTDPFKSAWLEPLAKIDRLDLALVLRPVALRPSE